LANPELNRTARTAYELVRGLLNIYFRRVEHTGADTVPETGGGLVVSWHPNGLIDPALILTGFPRPVIFGARDGLFHWPILGRVIRALETVPIYRAKDKTSASPEARRAANEKSLNALAEAVAQGKFACLFPEGDSHDAPHLLELKTGAARLYYRARQLARDNGHPTPVIIPVGIHYDGKRTFRSNALTVIHPPVALSPTLDLCPPKDDHSDAAHERTHALTDELERVLREVVHATESWELHHLMDRARKLLWAERAARSGARSMKPSMEERDLGLERVWLGYYTRLEQRPQDVLALRAKVAEYDADLRALGIEDHHLDGDPRLVSPWLFALLAMQVLLVFLLLPPILLVGYLVNWPPALGLWLLSKLTAKKRKDEATIQVLFGLVAFPATWAATGFAAAIAHENLHAVFPTIPDASIGAGVMVACFGMLGALVAVRYLRVARETTRAVVVRFTRARRRTTIARLLAERSVLADGLVDLAAGLELPGEVGPDGRLHRAGSASQEGGGGSLAPSGDDAG
jgi:1-acyl-sn-glycerol-3-phosphate acyltransferase